MKDNSYIKKLQTGKIWQDYWLPLTFLLIILCIPYIFKFLTLKEIGLHLRYEFDSFVFLVMLGYCIIIKSTITDRFPFDFIYLIIVFLLPLIGLWLSGAGEMQVFGGMVFTSDAGRYYFDALRFNNGFLFSTFSARHPIFTGFLSTLLSITGRNLQITILILVILNIISIFFLTNIIKKTYGALISSCYLFMLFLFYRRFIGYPDTENLGLMLGVLGFTYLMISCTRKTGFIFSLIGLFFITVGLCVRPGPFFVIPAILLWISWKYQNTRVRNSIIGIIIVILGFGLNGLIYKITSPKESQLLSNFSYHLYGLSKGGLGWEQAYVDHPEIKIMDDVDAENYIYNLALDGIRRKPLLFVSGVLSTYEDFFSLQDQSVYGFVNNSKSYFFDLHINKYPSISKFIWLSLYFFSIIGITKLVILNKDPLNRLILYCIIGIFLSVPFLPPRDSAMMRVYAVTIPIILLLPSLGFYYLLRKIKIIPITRQATTESPNSLLLGICIVALLFLGPILIKFATFMEDIQEIKCQNNDIPVYIKISSGSYILIDNEKNNPSSLVPNISLNEFKSGMNTFADKELLTKLNNISTPALIANVINIKDGLPFWIVISNTIPKPSNNVIGLCGKWDQDILNDGLGFFIVE